MHLHARTQLVALFAVLATGAALGPSPDDAPHGRELRHSSNGAESTFLLFVLGLLLFVLAPAFLWGVEQSGVRTTQLLNRAKKLTVTGIEPDRMGPRFDGQMVHVTAKLELNTDWGDDKVGVRFPHAVRVLRKVEVFSWVEHEREVEVAPGSNNVRKEYTYQAEWHLDDADDSSRFHMAGAPRNPRKAVSVASDELRRTGALRFGTGLELSPETFDRVDWLVPCTLPSDGSVRLAPAVSAAGGAVEGGAVYVHQRDGQVVTPGGPAVGDMRISYMIASLPEDHTLSAVGVKSARTLRPFVEADATKILGKVLAKVGGGAAGGADAEAEALKERFKSAEANFRPEDCQRANACQKAGMMCNVMVTLVAPLVHFLIGQLVGTDVLLLAPGAQSRERMYAHHEWKVEKLLTFLRAVGTLLFVLAIYWVLHPFAAIFAFIPFLKAMLSAFFLLAAVLLGVSCGLLTIGVAWCVVRPARACVLFVVLAALYAIGTVGQSYHDTYYGDGYVPADAAFSAEPADTAFGADSTGYNPNVLPPPASFTGGLYTASVKAPLAAYTPTIFFGLAALVALGLAVKEWLQWRKFEKAAKADLDALTSMV